MDEKELLERIDRRTERNAEKIEEMAEHLGSAAKEIWAMKGEHEHLKTEVFRHNQMMGELSSINTRLSTMDTRLAMVEESNRLHRKAFEDFKEKRLTELERNQKEIEAAEKEASVYKRRTIIGVITTGLTALAAWLWNRFITGHK